MIWSLYRSMIWSIHQSMIFDHWFLSDCPRGHASPSVGPRPSADAPLPLAPHKHCAAPSALSRGTFAAAIVLQPNNVKYSIKFKIYIQNRKYSKIQKNLFKIQNIQKFKIIYSKIQKFIFYSCLKKECLSWIIY